MEAAGLVLAIYPLLISSLQVYSNTIKPLKEQWRYRHELDRFVRALKVESLRFREICELLISGIGHTSEIATLLQEPEASAWKVPELESYLKRRLGRSHAGCLEIIKDSQAMLSELVEKLPVDEDGNTVFRNESWFKQEYKKLKFSLSGSKLRALIGRIQEQNDRLMVLVQEDYQPELRRSKAHGVAEHFSKIQQHAKSVYEALSQSWTCSCRAVHAANLYLQLTPISSPTNYLTNQKTDSLSSSFTFLYLQVDEAEPSLEFEIVLETLEVSPASPQISTTTAQSYLPLHKGNLSRTSKPSILSSRKGVRFATSSTIPIMDSKRTLPSMESTPSMPLIQDLCLAIRQSQCREDCIGFLEDSSKQRYTVRITGVRQNPVMRSLSDVLSTSLTEVARKTDWGMSRRKRLHLAVMLASAVLQYHKTSWLAKTWSSQDIIILPGDSNSFDVNAYTTSSIPASIIRSNPLPSKNQSWVQNTDVFSLGCMLIELCFTATLNDLRQPQDLDSNGCLSPFSDFFTAKRLLEKVYTESGPRYGDAVSKCIHCSFDAGQIDLDKWRMIQAVYDGVVMPLLEDLKAFESDLRG